MQDTRAETNPLYNANRLKLGSATYDLAGNLIADPIGRDITYDAENRQTAFNAGSGSGGLAHYPVSRQLLRR